MKKRRHATPTYCGSRLVVDPNTVLALVGHLGVCCERAQRHPFLALEEAHNAMALYTLMMLLFAKRLATIRDSGRQRALRLSCRAAGPMTAFAIPCWLTLT